jgi:hypothetical protein
MLFNFLLLQVPAWPFVTASFAFGVFALLPYFALWRPDPSQRLPPPEAELVSLTGRRQWGASLTADVHCCVD